MSLPHMLLKHMIKLSMNGKESHWKYISNIKSIFTNRGLDDVMFRDEANWYSTFVSVSNDQREKLFFERMTACKSLIYYNKMKKHMRLENYLKNDRDFYGARLKFLARSNNFSLESHFQAWGMSDGNCKFCNKNEFESLIHRLLICPHFNVERTTFYNNVSLKCHPGIASHILESSNEVKILLLLGDDVNLDWGHAQWTILDRLVKRYLISIFKPLCK